MDLYMPRKFLTEHLEKLVEDGTIRGVGQAAEFAEAMAGGQPAMHRYVYVTHNRNRKFGSQGANSIVNTQVYTLILVWRNNRPHRSGEGHGMDEAGTVQDAIEWHVHGMAMNGNRYGAKTGRAFMITDPPETFYRAGGWEFLPMSFEIEVNRKRLKKP